MKYISLLFILYLYFKFFLKLWNTLTMFSIVSLWLTLLNSIVCFTRIISLLYIWKRILLLNLCFYLMLVKKYPFLNSLGIFFSQYSNFSFFPLKYGIYYYLSISAWEKIKYFCIVWEMRPEEWVDQNLYNW